MQKNYYPTIGLEIHAELKTQTKMFCACKNDPDEEKPNVNICPVCMAHPGALPVINKKAVENVIKVGLAVDGKIADFTEFDRKNYFYPDIPKGYQISQYKFPIVFGGHLADFDITRVHLEEDTANNKHDRGDFSLIDFNRAGVPLMELVTEPHTFDGADEAGKGATKFAKELQLILWYLGVSEANMEKGEMRVEANISVSTDKKVLGTKVEVKNLNSFRSVERAIKYEIDRMTELLEKGKGAEIAQETRGWDESKQKTFSQRKKEGSADYRYFPDPDLPKLKLYEAFDLKKMKKELPELPEDKRLRYKKDYGIKDEDTEVYINNPVLGTWFELVIKELKEKKELIQLASNYIKNDIAGLVNTVLVEGTTKYPNPKNFAKLVNMNFNKEINSAVAKKLLGNLVTFDENVENLAKEEGLLQISDEKILKQIAERIIDANLKVVADYKGGKEQALMSLVGQIMKETKGSANPAVTKQILIDLLK
ncbi:Asp-tRNA(Asn)/Glu-tRNA(Gln) amidotransferase subunit GatB [Candidatus Nomurabacteria bacterium]|nr:Asp-tRNA(Asn)/Glu-tRNA(Gln) amidotransferase subunit GatB [Candidatus Nomurabacteria bacterium]